MSDTVLRREELACAVTHGVGVAASLSAGAVLITLAAVFGNGWQLASAVVFSLALVVVYSASTLLHSVGERPLQHRLRIFDHASIFVLIAATYTPFALVHLRGPLGWTLFGLVWGVAVAGIVFKIFFTGRFEWASTAIYHAMGWLCAIAVIPVLDVLSTASLVWLLLGGVAYSLGTIFYHSRRIPFSHAIWHLFVLSGSACHFTAVFAQVVPV